MVFLNSEKRTDAQDPCHGVDRNIAGAVLGQSQDFLGMDLPEAFQLLVLFPVISFVEISKQRDGKGTAVFGGEIHQIQDLAPDTVLHIGIRRVVMTI